MYPHLTDLINDLLGTNLLFPAQTFGFFVALAFIVAFQVLTKDMTSREAKGQFRLDKVKTRIKGPIEISEVWIQGVIWTLVGYKLGHGILNWAQFSVNPAEIILSPDGSFLFALLFGGVAAGLKYRTYHQLKDVKETFEDEWLGPSRHLGTIVTIAFVAGILGAKVFHNLEYFEDFSRDPLGSLVSFDGLTFYGGLITAGFFIIRFLKKRNYDLLLMVDTFAPCLILAYAVGRIGCQLAGDGDWGIANPDPMPAAIAWLPDWMWSFDFPGNVAKDGVLMEGCVGEFCYHLDPPVWPTPFYETIVCTLIFGILWFMRSRYKYMGQITAAYMFLNGMERFWIEKIRVNSEYIIMGMKITQAEIISSCLILGGIAVFVYSTYFYKKEIPTDMIEKSKAMPQAE